MPYKHPQNKSVRTPGFESRIRPPYPQRVVEGDLRGGVSESPLKKVGPVSV